MTNYQAFCEAAKDLPVFMQHWHLDAVCGPGNWSAVFVEKQGRAIGAWPFYLKKKMFWRHVTMPPLVKMMGPFLLPDFRGTYQEPALIGEMLEKLPPLAAFEQDCNYHFSNWLPLFNAGFQQTTRYSYALKINDLEEVWAGISADYKNQKIKKAANLVRLKVGGDLAEFYRVHNLSFIRQGMKPPFSFQFLQKLDAALAVRSAREIFFAEDLETGQVHSVAYVIFDKNTAYLLLAGDDPALRSSGAGIFLTWETIKHASNMRNVKEFDFLGSMIPAVERVRRQFGASPKPYFRVWKHWSPVWRLGKFLQKITNEK